LIQSLLPIDPLAQSHDAKNVAQACLSGLSIFVNTADIICSC
jgi:hypothetical protein